MTDSPRLYIALYTDQDVTTELAIELRKRNYMSQSALEAGMSQAPDLEQLEYAAERGMTLLTYNVDHFVILNKQYLEQGKTHSGVVVSAEQFNKRQLGQLLYLTLQLLDTYDSEQMLNLLVYLQQFK